MASSGDSSGWLPPFKGFSTDAIHAGQDPEQWKSKLVVPAITLATTFKQEAPGEHSGYEYSRSGNPTRTCLEKCVAAVEGGKHALAFSSGLAATQIIINLLNAGDHVVTTDDVYGGTNRYFRRVASKFNLEFSFVDFTNLKNVENAIKSNTKLLWVETPTNPTMKITDVRAVVEIAKRQKDILVVVDNTFMSSYFQRPLSLGADISYHSATKYMNGHTDVVMGLIIVNDDELRDKLYFLQYGLKTLALRMEQHQKNAIAVAKFLEKHPLVEKVKYAGLPSHPQYEIMQKQQRAELGIGDNFVRLSVGLEDVKDLIEDIDQALKAATSA